MRDLENKVHGSIQLQEKAEKKGQYYWSPPFPTRASTHQLRRFLHKDIFIFPEEGAIGIAWQRFHLEVPLVVASVISNCQVLLQLNLEWEGSLV